MDIMTCVDSAIEFAKDKLDSAMNFWDSLEEDKKKLLIGCAIAAVAVIAVASIAYGIGKAQGRKLAFEEEEDF